MNPDPAPASDEPGDAAVTADPVDAAERKKGTRLSTSLTLGFARLFGLEPFLTDIVTPNPADSPDQTIRFDLER
ncbi:hypothetical protein R54767_00509 [Paraburkholderia gardini]|uniref:Uncharacterized protein n=2 Tax=Paraburkholderia gardini TaxID=2823469 RepID=A0ABN7QIS6_9BURK|nr:hypothetical protein R54767_00509 [Paraburkholderia gardini]